jgi:hypothetical protein
MVYNSEPFDNPVYYIHTIYIAAQGRVQCKWYTAIIIQYGAGNLDCRMLGGVSFYCSLT